MMARMITQDELAGLLNVSRRTIIRMRQCGRIPKETAICRKVQWDRVIIDEWITAGCPPRSQWERQRKGK